MDNKVGYMVTGYRTFKGEEAECRVGSFVEGNLAKTFADAKRAGEEWAEAQKRAFIEYHIEPIYEPEDDPQAYVPFEER